MKIKKGQVWEMKPEVFEAYKAEGRNALGGFQYHKLIVAVQSEDVIITERVDETTWESYHRETMWAAARSKKEALDRGHKYRRVMLSYMGQVPMTARDLMKDYDYKEEAAYL